MKNYVQNGEMVYATAPTGGVLSGHPYLFGSLFGISAVDADAGSTFALWVRGVYNNMPKATGAAWTFGEAIYWDDTAKNCTGTATGNTKIGVATKAAASGDTTGEVRLNGAF